MRIVNAMITVDTGFPRHNHEAEAEYEFHFLLDNGGVFLNDGVEFEGKAGSLFFSIPAAWHCAWVKQPGQLMTIYSVSFLPDKDEAALVESVVKRFAAEPEMAVGKGCSLVFEDIRRKTASGDRLQTMSANHRLLSFMYDILSGQARSHPPRGQMYIDEALCIMQANISGNVDLDELCVKLGIEKSYFIRIFKQAMGIPPRQYYIALKMAAAGYSLQLSGKTVRQIASDFGYADEFYFSRQFKLHMGFSPQEYRANK